MAKKQSTWLLAFLSLGVVFGDIGTSPLYALKETFFGHHQLERSPENVLGALSLFFWSLAVVVTLKYIFLITRADNEGEGGHICSSGPYQTDQRSDARQTLCRNYDPDAVWRCLALW